MDAVTAIACALLVVGGLVYMFTNLGNTTAPATKTRLDYLRERKDVVYDNLRDLNFEFRAGKYPAEDYAVHRESLEHEAAGVVEEMDRIEALAKRR